MSSGVKQHIVTITLHRAVGVFERMIVEGNTARHS
jgi:hypothetical protein